MVLRQLLSVTLCLFALTVSTALADAPHYTVTDLGASGKISQAEAINNRGQVVGWQDKESFLWENGRQQIISTQPYQGAHGINEVGQVVGIPGEFHMLLSGSTLSGASAFVWDRGYLDYLPGFSEAYSINAQGQIAGESSDHATIWERRHVSGALNNAPNFIWQSLPAYKIKQLSGYPYSIAYSLNSHSEVVGTMLSNLNNIPEHGRAFRYQDGKADFLPIPSHGSSTAFSINELGMIAGMFHKPSSAWQAALWPPTGAMQTLPPLLGYATAVAHSLNETAQVVGWAAKQFASDTIGPSPDARACLWQGGSVYDLNTAIPADSGWILQEARAINNKGWIVGGGMLHGKYHAFLLSPLP